MSYLTWFFKGQIGAVKELRECAILRVLSANAKYVFLIEKECNLIELFTIIVKVKSEQNLGVGNKTPGFLHGGFTPLTTFARAYEGRNKRVNPPYKNWGTIHRAPTGVRSPCSRISCARRIFAMVIRTGVAPLRPYKWVGRVVWNAGAPNSSGGFGGHWLIIMPGRTMTCQAYIKHKWSINQK